MQRINLLGWSPGMRRESWVAMWRARIEMKRDRAARTAYRLVAGHDINW